VLIGLALGAGQARVVAGFADLVIEVSAVCVIIADGVGGAGTNAGKIDGVVVLSLIGAGLEGEEEHLDDDLIHGIIFPVVWSNQADIGGFDIEVPGIGHGEVELREAKEHSAAAVIFNVVGDAGQSCAGGGEDHGLVLHDGFVVVLVDGGVDEDRGGAYEFDVVVVLGGYVVVDEVAAVEEGLDLYEVVYAQAVGEFKACDGGHGPEVGLVAVPVGGGEDAADYG